MNEQQLKQKIDELIREFNKLEERVKKLEQAKVKLSPVSPSGMEEL
jgi:prefoldin subunit 5